MVKPRYRSADQTSKCVVLADSPGTSTCHTATRKRGVPAIIQGLRRPQRVPSRSLRLPIKGSVTTSSNRETAIAAPTAASGSPSSSA